LRNIQKIDSFTPTIRNNRSRNSSTNLPLLNLFNKLKDLKLLGFIWGRQKGFKFLPFLTKRWVDLFGVAFFQVE
jgi:hypothetical protein